MLYHQKKNRNKCTHMYTTLLPPGWWTVNLKQLGGRFEQNLMYKYIKDCMKVFYISTIKFGAKFIQCEIHPVRHIDEFLTIKRNIFFKTLIKVLYISLYQTTHSQWKKHSRNKTHLSSSTFSKALVLIQK